MPPPRFDLRDLLFGLFLIAVAAAMVAATWKLRVGTAGNMGPGYMPRAIAVGIAAFGIWFTARGLLRPGPGIPAPHARPIFGILAAVAVFALLVTKVGLALASLATVVVAGFASRETRFVETLVFAVLLSAGASLVFVKALSLPVPLWPW